MIRRLLRIIAVIVVVVGIVAGLVFLAMSAKAPHGCPFAASGYDEHLIGRVRQISEERLTTPFPTEHSVTGNYRTNATIDYDRRSRKIREVQTEAATSPGFSPGMTFSCNYRYNWHGELTEVREFLDRIPCIDKLYIYRPAGRVVEVRGYDPQSTGKRKKTSWFDKIVALFEKPSRGKLMVRTVMKLDNKGRVAQIIGYDENGKQEHNASYNRDSRGYMTSLTRVVYGPVTQKLVFRNDDKGNILEERTFRGSRLTRHIKLSYKFDARGNWVERVGRLLYHKNDKAAWTAVSRTKRTIKYYTE